nr:DinB family protein [Chryseobacterium sp. CBo1]
MTKKYLKEIAEYSNWADSSIINWLEQIDDEKWEKEIESSFNSIFKTVLHIVGAKKI